MARKKRGNTWHCDFVVDGIRYRQSLETSDWREAQAKQKDLIAKAGKLAADSQRKAIARLSFKDAAERFTADREPNLAPSSTRNERDLARRINEVFGPKSVSSITADDVLAYIRSRKAAGIANATINRELDIIRGVLKKAKKWHRFADEVRPLKVTESIGRALTHEQKVRLLRLAATRSSWQAAFYASVLAFNTTCRGCELKGLQWRDVDLVNKTITIRRSKTDAGLRMIPLNADAFGAVMALYERGKGIAAVGLAVIAISRARKGL